MDLLLDLIFDPRAVIGIVIGLGLAAIVHWSAPAPEPLMLEAGLVVLGFLGGILMSWAMEVKKREEQKLG